MPHTQPTRYGQFSLNISLVTLDLSFAFFRSPLTTSTLHSLIRRSLRSPRSRSLSDRTVTEYIIVTARSGQRFNSDRTSDTVSAGDSIAYTGERVCALIEKTVGDSEKSADRLEAPRSHVLSPSLSLCLPRFL